MGHKARGSADDARLIQVTDFSAGLNSMYGGLALELNECVIAGTQNVIGFPGRALYVGGFSSISSLPSNVVDNAYQFYDANKKKHQMVWANGNLYDVVSGSAVVIKTGAYTAGEDVGRVDQKGVLYYCTKTVALRQYDGTTEQATSGTTPKGTYLTALNGSLLCANPTPNGSTYQPGAFIPSNVNDPTTWQSANMQQVGTDYGGIISFIMPMGVSSAGVSPTNSMVVGMTAGHMFLYTGAIGSQKEAIINCPVGCLDPYSAVYVPAPTLFGQVLFLGTDYQLWGCDGIIADMVSQDKDLSYIYGLVSNARVNLSTQRFFATYNNRYAYYLLDLGNNQQLIYRWRNKSFWFINGWPSGAYFAGTDASGFTKNYVAATASYTAGVYNTGQDAVNFGGVAPSISYQTPYLHGGNAELDKIWEWVALGTRNIGAVYTVTGNGMPFADNTSLTSQALTFADPANSGSSGVQAVGTWDVSNWDAALWAPDPNTALIAPAIKHGMLSVSVPVSTWVPYASTQPLRSGAASFKIAWKNDGSAPPGFDITLFQARFNPRSMRTVGGSQYESEAAPAVANDPYNVHWNSGT